MYKLTTIGKKAMISRTVDFVKYHNAFTIGLVLVLFGGGVIFAASPEAREAVSEAIGQEVVVEQAGVDNAALLAADLAAFDPQMKVENVSEDEKNYYVDYSFQTLGIQDNVWRPISRQLSMTIDKLSLQGGDLGLYVQKQLNEIAQNQLAYLKQAQLAEQAKGKTEIAKTTEYTGLIGLVLDLKNAILPGYEPVVKTEIPEIVESDPTATSTPETAPSQSTPETVIDGKKTYTDENGVLHTYEEKPAEIPKPAPEPAEPAIEPEPPAETPAETPSEQETPVESEIPVESETPVDETSKEPETSVKPETPPAPDPAIIDN